MTDLTSMTIAEAKAGLANKSFTSLELTDAHLAAIEAARSLNAFVLETPDQARAMARAIDAKIAKGEGGPLAGIPLGIKDLFATKDVRTTACSKILGNFVPPYESTVTSQLWRDGAVMLGKLNNDEFAMGSSNETSCFGPVVNPWRREGSNTTLVPGGSSGGSASAVAALLCMGATATDTGGSIRQPAAFTATVGVKPTYGRCSRWGIVAFASSLDQAGPIARTTRDAAILMRSMAGHDPKDTTSVDRAVPDYEAAIGKSVKGMKIGIPKEYRLDGMPAEIEKLWSRRRGVAEGGRRRTGRGVAAAHQIRAAGLLHRGAGGSLVQPRALRRRALRPARAGPLDRRIVREHPRRRLWRRSAPPRHDRHLCALGRLLRRLLSARAKSPHPDQEGF